MGGILKFIKNKKKALLIFIICIITSVTIVMDNKIKDVSGNNEEKLLQSENIEELISSSENGEKQEMDEIGEGEPEFVEKSFTGRTTEVVNFREAPSITASLISILEEKTIVEVLGVQGEWNKIKFNSKEGWISSKYLAEYTDIDKKADEESANRKKDTESKQKEVVQNTNSSNNENKNNKGFKNPAFANSTQVVLVTADNMNTSYCNIKFYEKSGDEWNVITDVNGRIGANGLAYIKNRKQSTNKTPAGILNIISAFGVEDNPGSKYSYTKVTENMFWDLNSGNSTYNRLINNNPGGDYEHLSSYPSQYKYFLVTDYNYSQTPDKGGAIFLHVNGNGGTGGCVSMPESYMRDLITWIDPAQNPKILIIPSSDLGEYWY